ncbi:hypothetical protein TWF718_009704 [Orbilia javanica]|uniref:Uncharacterized protein n=1 Tax=Orbilia javanica TaxID=47235 RepID=A0AAN8MZM5_9PEZI
MPNAQNNPLSLLGLPLETIAEICAYIISSESEALMDASIRQKMCSSCHNGLDGFSFLSTHSRIYDAALAVQPTTSMPPAFTFTANTQGGQHYYDHSPAYCVEKRQAEILSRLAFAHVEIREDDWKGQIMPIEPRETLITIGLDNMRTVAAMMAGKTS